MDGWKIMVWCGTQSLIAVTVLLRFSTVQKRVTTSSAMTGLTTVTESGQRLQHKPKA